MDKRDLEQLLSDVAGGSVTPAVALTRIQTAPTADLGFAQLDLSRWVRQGAGEVIYGAGKTPEQIAAISSFSTLLPGDVIMTGTPNASGHLDPGDETIVHVEGIGDLRNVIVRA